jgi:flagellar hook-length control protein FliK
MEVRIDLTKDQAQVTFLSPHAGVRDALEGQMQRLREMFTQQGMNLMDVNVSDQSLARGWQGGADGGSSRGGASGEGDLAGDEPVIADSSTTTPEPSALRDNPAPPFRCAPVFRRPSL